MVDSNVKRNIVLARSYQIDSKLWDRCIEESINPSIYCTYDYINDLSKDWFGLIIDNYSAILALPFKNFFFLKLLYTPDFIPYLDLIVRKDFDLSPYLPDIVSIIKERFSIMFFRSKTLLFDDSNCIKRVNMYLPLDSDYGTLLSHFTEECQKNIKKALVRCSNVCIDKVSINDVIDFYSLAYGHLNIVSDSQYDRLAKVFQKKRSENEGFTISVEDKEGKCLYAAYFLHYKGRLIYILGAPSKEGRQARATYRAMNYIIENYANKHSVLDFEGSSIPSVAKFYEGFGSQCEFFWDYKYNRLPFPIKQLFSLRFR